MMPDIITVKNEKGAEIENKVFGLFFEDINYAADGGIMAELVENYSFEFFNDSPQFDYGWTIVGNAEFAIESEKSMNKNNLHYAHVKTSEPMEGIKNKCYDGVFLKKGEMLNVSLYAQTDCEIVFLVGDNCAILNETAQNGEWVKYTGVLSCSADIRGEEAKILLKTPGEALIDMVSVIKSDAVMGLFRKDIVDALALMKPGFIRFPGGCAVEGGCDLSTAYRWKETVGPREERKLNKSRWQNGEAKFYCQSFNLGFYEYFLLCEHLEAKPLPVVNVGLACMVNENPEGVPVYKENTKNYKNAKETDLTDEFMEYINDMLDLVDFANSTDFENNYYARLRRSMGHEAPFNLEFIGIGNEQWERGESRWHERYFWAEHFLHKKDKSLKLISSAAWYHTGHEYHTNEYKFNGEMLKNNPDFTYALDEHYYETPDWFYENIDYYDKYQRDVKVFLGEVSARWDKVPGDYTICTLENALAEAAYFTMVERNSDIVKMVSAAPLLCRAGGKRYSQWSPNMVWFDGESVFLTPSYYVQLMYAQNPGCCNLVTEVCGEKLYANAVTNKTGEVILKIVNASDEEKTVMLDIGFSECEAAVITLTGEKMGYNSIENPTNIAPVQTTEKLDKERLFPPYSFTVLRIKGEK